MRVHRVESLKHTRNTTLCVAFTLYCRNRYYTEYNQVYVWILREACSAFYYNYYYGVATIGSDKICSPTVGVVIFRLTVCIVAHVLLCSMRNGFQFWANIITLAAALLNKNIYCSTNQNYNHYSRWSIRVKVN